MTARKRHDALSRTPPSAPKRRDQRPLPFEATAGDGGIGTPADDAKLQQHQQQRHADKKERRRHGRAELRFRGGEAEVVDAGRQYIDARLHADQLLEFKTFHRTHEGKNENREQRRPSPGEN